MPESVVSNRSPQFAAELMKELQGNEWQMEGDLVLKERKMYIPKNEELRAEVIQLHHDLPTAGHGGK